MSTDAPATSIKTRLDQAARNARWWRARLEADRVDPGADFEWLLRDLEVAAGVRAMRAGD
jgi:hypothetical protein